MDAVLAVHIAGGALALLTGFTALAATKGQRLHRRAGIAFVAAMLVMGLTGAGVAAATGVGGSVIGGLLAAYLTLSGFMVIRPATPPMRRVSLAGVWVGLPLGLVSAASGVSTLAEGSLVRDGVPVPMIFLFATVALSSAAGDLHRLRSGPARGRRKLAAHLWRMCFALFIASGSFFLGQTDEIPEALRVWPALIGLAVLPLVAIPYFLWRVRGRGAESIRVYAPMLGDRDVSHRPADAPPTAAAHSISTRAPAARPEAAKVLRAGLGPGK